MNKSVVFSAVQPSGILTIGNYIGAIQQWIKMQDKYDCIYSIVDLHTITVKQDPLTLRKNILNTIAIYLACGIDPKKSIIFIQSHVPAHVQLSWILNCYVYFNELKRMTQFKKKKKNRFNNGLFTYPVLMASDILLYKTDIVPVGKDQKQHLELSRILAKRFNNIYGDLFKIPKSYIIKNKSNILSLSNIEKKMSKSDISKNSFISLLDTKDIIKKKIRKAITDSDTPPTIHYDPKYKKGISNLLIILSSMSEKNIFHLEKKFSGKTYNSLKNEVIDILTKKLFILQEKYFYYINNYKYLIDIIHDGAERAKLRANNTLREIYNKIGFF
ncbi:tryptophan--tRNA ligase [Candidatus Purcelliella pentastirinorum]|uniref:Tryptophan--tRNA ligase n=1 Tax=Candidatus Purcelliella pentastirinorum TaxID=472834 RepID=A0AAX3N813_9ENTR|nr:tryptophan--tRNA ligase [Candidatus Purcelliella pentastirinorum]WDI78707.1 tryptophan--tRNA ligase [Candidatus Purcelliella pentastirinorum]WDR80681.1 tryptophan--tRNA ligase [Candidatus Purcelliella pentastirinorum]